MTTVAEKGIRGGETDPEDRYFTPVRWDQTEQITSDVWLYRPIRGEFSYPRSVDGFLARSATAFRAAFDLLAAHDAISTSGARITRFGFLLQPSEGELLLGLNVCRAGSLGEYGVYICPFLPERLVCDEVFYGPHRGIYQTPHAAAERIALTMLHELAHVLVHEEGLALLARADELERTLPGESLQETVDLITKVLAGGAKKDVFSRQYLRNRDGYLQAARRSRRALAPGDLLRFTGERPETGPRER
jgi:hypothetical protein